MAIKPLNDIVWIELPEICERSAGGIILASSEIKAQERGSEIGKILGMGPTAFADEEIKPKVGEYISFARYAGRIVPTKNGARPQRLVFSTEIYAIVDDEYLRDANVVLENKDDARVG